MKAAGKKVAQALSPRSLAFVLAAVLASGSSVCMAGGVPTAPPPPAPHPMPQQRFDVGEFQMLRNQLRRHLNRIDRRQWALEACRKKHPPKTKARAKCLAKARKLPPG